MMISQHWFRYQLGASGTKSLPEPMLTKLYDAICRASLSLQWVNQILRVHYTYEKKLQLCELTKSHLVQNLKWISCSSEIFKDLSMMYRALWDRRHEGAEWPLSASDLTMHDTSCLNPIMIWFIWFWYITKPKFASEVAKREVANHAL